MNNFYDLSLSTNSQANTANIANIKAQFPLFQTEANRDLVYLDNAATTQKPAQVLVAIDEYYRNHNANVHRGVHRLADESTTCWEDSLDTIAKFFGATSEEFIFTSGTTAAINGVAMGYLRHNLLQDEAVVITIAEHHANLVVWQEVCREIKARLIYAPLMPDGTIDLKALEQILKADKVRLVAINYISNVTGIMQPVEQITSLIKKSSSHKTRLLIDGAQAAGHLPINFSKLGADFFAFSGHKMYGPMGSGVLLVKKSILESGEMQPWLFGGGMIDQVTEQSTTFALALRDRFSAGTPDVAAAVGLASACQFLTEIGMEKVVEHDREITAYALERLSENPELNLLFAKSIHHGLVSFTHQKCHAHDVAQVLDHYGIAVRSGHHCAMPLHTTLGINATVRASFAIYNDKNDVDRLVMALTKLKDILKYD